MDVMLAGAVKSSYNQFNRVSEHLDHITVLAASLYSKMRVNNWNAECRYRCEGHTHVSAPYHLSQPQGIWMPN